MTERTMRAKVTVRQVEVNTATVDSTHSNMKAGDTISEKLTFNPVAKSGPYPADGSDEDNSFARWSPAGEFVLHVQNPNLFGKFHVGQKFYVDFTEAPDSPPARPAT